MRLVALLILLVFISACVGEGVQKAQFGFSEITTNPDIYLKASTTQETKSGRNISVLFTIQNKGEEDLRNVSLRAYDMCLFSGESEFKKDIKANRTEMWSWKWIAGETDFERDCEIKFRTEYIATTRIIQDVIVLTETEYLTRESGGTLKDISIQSSVSESPVLITIKFSENQPFVSGEENFMYIDYVNTGYGFINELSPGDINISFPSNMRNITCLDYELSDGIYVLKKPLRFLNGKGPKSTCSFTADATQPIDLKTLMLTANYKYSLDNSFIVKVKPK